MNQKAEKNFKRIYLAVFFVGSIFLLAILFLIYPKFFIKQLASKKPETAYFLNNNEKIKISIETAITPYEQLKGLMFRESMPEYNGMLFIFPNSETRSFWMKNTSIPLDIIFISKDKKIVDIKENFEPCPKSQMICPSYNSIAESMYVVEVNAGFVKKHNINISDKVEF